MKKAKGWTVVKNGSLFDGTGSPAQANSCVLIKDGLIQYAGPVAQAPAAPPEAVVVDAKKGTIMPGLVEAHFHATYFNVAELADLDIRSAYPTALSFIGLPNAALGRVHRGNVWWIDLDHTALGTVSDYQLKCDHGEHDSTRYTVTGQTTRHCLVPIYGLPVPACISLTAHSFVIDSLCTSVDAGFGIALPGTRTPFLIVAQQTFSHTSKMLRCPP